MPLLRKKRVLAAKIEATYGTAETLTGAEAAFNVFDPVITPNIETLERQSQSAFSPIPSVPGLRSGQVTFKTDLYGDGAGGIPGWASVFLPACGMVASSQVYGPVTAAPGSSVKSLTIGVYEDGLRKVLRGAVGTVKLVFETGKPAMLEWAFTGAWGGVTDAAILAPTYPTILPIRFANTSLTYGSWAPCVQSISFDLGNEVVLRECQTASDASGYAGAIVTGRKVTGSVNPEASLVASHDTYGKWLSSNEAAMTVVLADAADTITIAAPKAQLINVQEGDRSGIQTDEITFQCNRSAAAGDDEFTIEFAAT